MRYRVESPHPASENLAFAGPMVVVLVGLHYDEASSRLDRGENPPYVRLPLLIDTGAVVTLLDERVFRSMGLAPIRYDALMLADGKPQQKPVYKASISIPTEDASGRLVPEVFEVEMFGLDTGQQGHGGLLGRDLLRNFRLHYDGTNGTYELASDRDPAPQGDESLAS
jgi:predicted aspartyl protease